MASEPMNQNFLANFSPTFDTCYASKHCRNRVCRPGDRCLFSGFGHQVTCVDVDEQKLALLSQKILSIYEAKLDVLLSKNVDEKDSTSART